jgi:hypothetical protein
MKKGAKKSTKKAVKVAAPKDMYSLFWLSCISTILYEITISSPWWSGTRHSGYDVLFKLTAPSLILLLFAYYTVLKKQQYYATGLPIYIVFLQIAILFTVYGAAAGILH